MPTRTRQPTVHSFFSPNGLLSQWHPNYEFRQGQLEMAEAVARALAQRKHLLVEAGTGTGKTLAYLVPAIISGRRIVISTGTKNLQEQLYFKDIPFLQQHFALPLRVCYMKGRNNYACRQKIYDAEREPILAGLEEVADFEIIREWETKTETGDRAEICGLPESSSLWNKIDARRELCSGQHCPQFNRCFLTLMYRKAAESDIIIVNHHLFFADLAVKQNDEFGGIIPPYAAVVFDEAHEIEEVAGQYFGVSISNYQIEDLRRDIAVLARRKELGSEELDRILISIDICSGQFFDLFGQFEGRTGFNAQETFLEKHGQAYRNLLRALDLAAAYLEMMREAPEEAIALHRRTRDLKAALEFWMESGDPSFVYWVEARGGGRYLQATPIDVSPILRERLFERVDTIILTSATLAVAGSFQYTQERLGLQGARALIVPGQFNYETQALLYIPEQMPDPRDPSFADAAASEILQLLHLSHGRAFVLFTSHQQMRQVYDKIVFDIPYPTLLQGTGPRHALLEEFRKTPNCVLFATSSFWQGVDVPGQQLSCVIIDKLPFAAPTDPVVAARIRRIREQDGNPFYDYQIPQAVLALKQGFGRLIRSRSDRGVLALLDSRIRRQRYGQVFFDSLPNYRVTSNLNEVENFFHV